MIFYSVIQGATWYSGFMMDNMVLLWGRNEWNMRTGASIIYLATVALRITLHSFTLVSILFHCYGKFGDPSFAWACVGKWLYSISRPYMYYMLLSKVLGCFTRYCFGRLYGLGVHENVFVWG